MRGTRARTMPSDELLRHLSFCLEECICVVNGREEVRFDVLRRVLINVKSWLADERTRRISLSLTSNPIRTCSH